MATINGWDCIELRREGLTLQLLPQIGGRIVGISWQGVELAWVNADLAGLDPVRTPRGPFRVWGGDKTWLAPQGQWPDGMPYVDLDEGAFDVASSADGVTMTSPLCRATGLRLVRSVMLGQRPGQWSVEHALINEGPHAVRCGVWDVSMLRLPAVVFFPAPRMVHVYEEEGAGAEVVSKVVEQIGSCARVMCDGGWKFKYGALTHDPWIAGYFTVPGARTLVHVKRMTGVPQDAVFAHPCSTEVFCSDECDYVELEVHGPLVELAPGDRTSSTELCWVGSAQQIPTTEDAVRSDVKRCGG
ncbi:MAG: hypothetical protein AAFX05_12650 [Planctomycetota bacterium]